MQAGISTISAMPSNLGSLAEKPQRLFGLCRSAILAISGTDPLARNIFETLQHVFAKQFYRSPLFLHGLISSSGSVSSDADLAAVGGYKASTKQ